MCSVKKTFLKFQKIHRKILVLETLFQCSCRPQACNCLQLYEKGTPAQMFLGSFAEFSKIPNLEKICVRLLLIFAEQLFCRHLQTSLIKLQAVWRRLPLSFKQRALNFGPFLYAKKCDWIYISFSQLKFSKRSKHTFFFN